VASAPDGGHAFPPDFLWGTATSAYQIEGGVDRDGRGASIWDTFAATPGRVRGGETGEVATDHRQRMAQDVALMAELGYPAYRFSVAWPRVQPAGAGALSAAGIDFYRRLVDELLDHDIVPVLTLYHWDLPQPLEDSGGWPVRDTALRFAEYAGVVAEALGDRVRHWSTLNEPWCAAMLGYASGVHAPGRQEPGAAVAAAHHLMLAHGLAVDVLRGSVRADAEIGITLNPYPVRAAGDGDADRDAARRVDGVANRLWLEPLLHRRYPDDVIADFAAVSDLSHVRDGDLDQIGRPVDAIGVNYYRRYHVRYAVGASSATPWNTWPGSPDVDLVRPEMPETALGWSIEPDGLTEVLLDLTRQAPGVALYVHENGAAFPDLTRADDGTVADTDRIQFLGDHVAACAEAVAAGVPLRGYFVWSLIDNFEWAHGYTPRFGLVAVEPETLRRRPKASARWYADLIRSESSRSCRS
jgi:beta-glucosidase